jgi:hypothetical protein
LQVDQMYTKVYQMPEYITESFWINLKGFWRWYMVYTTRMLMDYFHHPVFIFL